MGSTRFYNVQNGNLNKKDRENWRKIEHQTFLYRSSKDRSFFNSNSQKVVAFNVDFLQNF